MEISERFGFNLPSRDGDDLADINQISDNFRIIEDVVPYVDENYDPKSKNPQSGEAVFGAIKTVRNPILDYIVYEIAEDGTVDIVSCDKAIKGDYIIPDTIEGCLVTSIGKSFSPADRWAFEGCENLTSIIIPDSVTLIGIDAFSSCYNLKKIVMGSGISTIGESAFYNCLALKEITIPESITKIDTGAFEKVDNLADVYYNGTSEQWNEIIVRGKNEPLVNATIHFNYDPTLTTKGYVDEALRNAVDQTYSPESPNAQSGIAVAEAVANANGKLTTIADITIAEDAVNAITIDKNSFPDIEKVKDFYITFVIEKPETAQSGKLFILGRNGKANRYLGIADSWNHASYVVNGNFYSKCFDDYYRFNICQNAFGANKASTCDLTTTVEQTSKPFEKIVIQCATATSYIPKGSKITIKGVVS